VDYNQRRPSVPALAARVQSSNGISQRSAQNLPADPGPFEIGTAMLTESRAILSAGRQARDR
jgi:hypothetical protein